MKRANRLSCLVAAYAPLVVCGCAGITPPTVSLDDYGPLVEARARPVPVSLLGRRLEPLGREAPPASIANLDAAWAAFRENPNDVDRLIWVARRLGYLRRMNEAIALLSEGLRVHPNHAGLLRHRGHRYLSVRRFEDARADLERAAELIGADRMRADPGRCLADIVEQDGLPNARNIPLTTLGFNVWYHLGLSRYLTGDYAGCVSAFEEAARLSRGFDDNRVATTYWTYLATRRQGRDAEARRLLDAITPDMDIIENQAYHRLLLIFRDGRSPDAVAPLVREGIHAPASALDNATTGYGIGCLHLFTGDTAAARAAFERVVSGDEWPAFGFIAAEAELARDHAGTSLRQIAMSDKQLFESVKIGMSRADVEKQLGKAVLEFDKKVYYGKPPKIESWRSPVVPASISIIYSDRHVVESKTFYDDNNDSTTVR